MDLIFWAFVVLLISNVLLNTLMIHRLDLLTQAIFNRHVTWEDLFSGVDIGFYSMYKQIDRLTFENKIDKRAQICKLFCDKKLDLNAQRELIEEIAMFTVNIADIYQAEQEKLK